MGKSKLKGHVGAEWPSAPTLHGKIPDAERGIVTLNVFSYNIHCIHDQIHLRCIHWIFKEYKIFSENNVAVIFPLGNLCPNMKSELLWMIGLEAQPRTEQLGNWFWMRTENHPHFNVGSLFKRDEGITCLLLDWRRWSKVDNGNDFRALWYATNVWIGVFPKV